MSFRIVVVSKTSKLSFKDNYLYIRAEESSMVHLSEINTLIIESTMVQVSARLLTELINFKIKVIVCDETHNPCAELVPYHSSFNSSKKILLQTQWDEDLKKTLWTSIVANKIKNQAMFLKKYGLNGCDKLLEYISQLELNDVSNREGHSAKVYFNSVFGKEFTRDGNSANSCALNYGYTILLSAFNRAISGLGYINQLGIKHKNEYNPFNLACDLMEPFRVLVDDIVLKNNGRLLDSNYKQELIDVLNKEIVFAGKNTYLVNAIPIFVAKCINVIENQNIMEYVPYEFGV